VYALGDVANVQRKFSHTSGTQAGILATNIQSALQGKPAAKTYSETGSFIGLVQLARWGASSPKWPVRR
jgi:NADH dehydrogenase FAD-containing subunit